MNTHPPIPSRPTADRCAAVRDRWLRANPQPKGLSNDGAMRAWLQSWRQSGAAEECRRIVAEEMGAAREGRLL